ncbi:Transthyretin-like family protein [Cooperia oncophora]
MAASLMNGNLSDQALFVPTTFAPTPESSKDCEDLMLLLLALIVPLGVVGLPDILPQIRTLQSTAVKGKLLCNGKPYEKARPEALRSRSTQLEVQKVSPLSVKDTLMDEAFSDKDGQFKLKGNDTEWSKIDPKLNIYHNCEDEKVIIIPDDYVTEGGEPNKTFDIGILNLNAKLPGETRDCLN